MSSLEAVDGILLLTGNGAWTRAYCCRLALAIHESDSSRAACSWWSDSWVGVLCCCASASISASVGSNGGPLPLGPVYFSGSKA